MSNFYKFITSNASLWTGAGSLKSKYSATTIYQIRSVWYETTGTTPTAKFTAGETQPDETQPDNKSYINVYLVLNVNQSSPTTCELHKIRFEFSNPVATVDDITSWTKDWPTTLTGSWTDINVGWNVSTKTVIDTDYAYNTSIITLGTETAKYYGYRVNYPARNFADFVSTSASIRGYAGSYHERMDPIYSIGTITHLDYNRIDATNDSPLFRSAVAGDSDPIYTTRIFHSNWGSNASFVYIRVAATTRNVNTRFGFKEKAPTYMNTVDWSTGDILNSVKWPTDISYSLNNNASPVENSWTQTSAQRQAWAYSLDTGTVANNVINNGGLIVGISYNTVYLTEYSTAYVPPSFNTTTASSAAKLSELTNILSGTPLEIYNVWYTTAQAEGSETTTCWVYYAYKDAQSVVHYSTQEVSYNNITNAWTLSAGVYEATKTSSVFDPTPTTYTALYVGMSPFDIDVSPTSLASLKTVYDASPYTNVNMSQIYNIWYDHTDTFNLTTPSPMTRTVDTWIYLLTDAPEDTSGNLIFETRRATYTITNTNASYTWTIPTDETITTTTHPDQISLGYSTSINTGYASIENSTLYYLAYFHFNIYTLTRENVVVNLIEQYSGINKVKTINEIWYDKSTIGADIYDASFNDTLLDVPEVSIKIYASGTNQGVLAYNSYDISYNKNIRNWPSIIANEISSQTITSGSMETWTYQQIYYNPFYDMASTITTIKPTYNELYPTPGMDKVVKLWNSSGNNNNQTQLLFTSFLLNSSEIIKYTTVVYNRVENIWSIPNAEEEFNNVLSETVKYYEFIISELNGYATEIKNIYNQRYTEINQIVEIHKLWYNDTSVANSTINCLLFYSYKNENDAVNKTHFATIPINYIRYDINEDMDAYFSISAEANLTEVEYTYDNQNADFIELVEYTNTPTFVLSTINLEPIMISNSAIREQFDTSYNEITGNVVNDIHTIWVNAVENVVSTTEGGITYSSPIIKALVYLSYSTQLYESREVEYDLMLNEWIITITDVRFNATNRTNGVDTAYTQIYINLPILSSFSPISATSPSSLADLKDKYANSFSPAAISSNALTLLKIWYRLDDAQAETVKCIVYLSISTLVETTVNKSYKTFVINYNNDNNTWNMPEVSVSVNSTESDDKFNTTIANGETESDYFQIYSLPTGPFINVSKDKILINNAQHIKLPIGSILMHSDTITTGDAFLICDGSAKDTATYPELSAVLDFKYGGSIASGKFNVPNLSDRFPIGALNVADSSISSDPDPYGVKTNRTGGYWQIHPSQFVHNHSSVSHSYISSFQETDGMDNESPTSNSQHGTTKVGTVTITHPNVNHKPPWFAVRYIIYTGRGKIGG